MLINKKIIYRSFIFLSFLFLFFVINSNSVFAADFEINVGSTEWKINSDGIYKNSSKIFCSDIQVGSISDNGFLVKNSSGTKLFLMAEDNIYVSAKDSFASLTYPASISDSFILKKANNDVLLYVDSSGLHYKEGMCGGISISTCGELQMIGNDSGYPLDGDYYLIQDVDCSDTVNWNGGAWWGNRGFNPIGTFTGTFNGNGFMISDLYIHRSENNIGLFAILGGAEVFDLTLDNFTVSNLVFGTNRWVGALAGQANDSYIYDCSVTNSSVTSYFNNVGGLIGEIISDTEIERCSSVDNNLSMNYSGHGDGLGGLIGSVKSGSEIRQCFSNSTLNGYDEVGGLVGYMSSSSILNSYSFSNISNGRYRLGGLVGYMSSGSVLNCYSVSNKALVAFKEGGTILASYYNSDLASSYGVYGEPRTTIQMTHEFAANTYEDWDFINIWKNDEINGHYPCLQWQDGNCPASLNICGNGVPESGEECDDGNTVTEFCGDGVIQTGIYCSSNCNTELYLNENCENDSNCNTPLYKCDNCRCVINYDCETNTDCEDRFDDGWMCDDCICKQWNPYGNKPNLVPYNICIGVGGECELSVDCGFDPASYCDQEAGCTCAVWPPEPKPAGTCGDDPPGCFPKGMKVYTPNGNISIEDIRAGDIVYSYNEDTGKLEESKVGKVFIHKDFRDPAVRLILSNGILLSSTLNHPFYSVKYGNYLPLEKFDVGDDVLFYNNKTGNFEEVRILEFKDVDYFYYEYSLHLEDPFNNYFVNGIIVHNASGSGSKGGDDPLD